MDYWLGSRDFRRPPVSNAGEKMRQAVILTAAFYTSSTLLQRISGAIFGMHGGRMYPLTVGWGVASTCCSLLLSQRGLHLAPPPPPSISFPADSQELLSSANAAYVAAKARLSREALDWRPEQLPRALWTSLTSSSKDRARQETMYQTFLGLASFAALERRSFRTALPSSVITTGVFAHTPLHWRWARRKSVIIATADAATDAQRKLIQQLGRVHGCHHCGSKQWLSGARFIADHMPPTKQVGEMNQARWRRLLGWTAKQQLLPQCQSCFGLQGSAVKQAYHRVVYHSGLRAWHAAPAVALVLLSDNEEVRRAVWPLVASADRQYRAARKQVQDLLDGYM